MEIEKLQSALFTLQARTIALESVLLAILPNSGIDDSTVTKFEREFTAHLRRLDQHRELVFAGELEMERWVLMLRNRIA